MLLLCWFSWSKVQSVFKKKKEHHVIAEHGLTGSESWNGSRQWLGNEANERVHAGGGGKREHAHNCQPLTKAANYPPIVQRRSHKRADCSPSFQTDFRWYAGGSNEMPLCAEPVVSRADGWKEEGAAEYSGVEAFCFMARGGEDVLFMVTWPLRHGDLRSLWLHSCVFQRESCAKKVRK